MYLGVGGLCSFVPRREQNLIGGVSREQKSCKSDEDSISGWWS